MAGARPGTATADESTTDESTTETSRSTDPRQEAIDSALAVQIALSYTGGRHVTEVEREFEHGRVEWKVRIETRGQRLDVRVDAATGAITRVDADDSRNDDSRGGDSYSDDSRSDDDGNSGPGGGDNSGGGDGHDDSSGDDRGGRG